MVERFQLSDFERYMHLLKCTSGNARKIIESVPSGELKYSTAIDLLQKDFACVTTQQFSVISKIMNLKLDNGQDGLKWIGEARILKDQMERLNICQNTFMQYFLWNGMSDAIKKHFMDVTESSYPDHDDILDNAFTVFNRMKEFKSYPLNHDSEYAKISKTVTLNTGVKSNTEKKSGSYSSNCWLCRNALNVSVSDHTIGNCSKFKSAEETLNDFYNT